MGPFTMLVRLIIATIALAWTPVFARAAVLPECCLRGYIGERAISRATKDLASDIHGGLGNAGVAIQQCYDRAVSLARASECMLVDMSAYNLDKGMREQFVSRGFNSIPVSRYFTEQAYRARMSIYADLIFGSLPAARIYYGNAVSRVMDGATK